MAGCFRSASGSTSTPSSSSGVAHRADCAGAAARAAAEAVSIPPAGFIAPSGARGSARACRPPFETLLTYQLERSVEALVP